tara:strand:+ start:1207 stop:1464 length:258 start_codon:yes stop_codon:yes gene_type:complete
MIRTSVFIFIYTNSLTRNPIIKIETIAIRKYLKKGDLLLFQFILSVLFLCLAEALRGPRRKKTPREMNIKSPKNIVLKSTIDFLI